MSLLSMLVDAYGFHIVSRDQSLCGYFEDIFLSRMNLYVVYVRWVCYKLDESTSSCFSQRCC